MTDKSVFAHEPDSSKRRGGLTSAGRHRGRALTEGEREQERRAKGRPVGKPGLGGEIEIADPAIARGHQTGYGKNQDEEQERKTAHNRAQGANEGAYRPAI